MVPGSMHPELLDIRLSQNPSKAINVVSIRMGGNYKVYPISLVVTFHMSNNLIGIVIKTSVNHNHRLLIATSVEITPTHQNGVTAPCTIAHSKKIYFISH